MPEIKLIAIDLDGTLLSDRKEIDPRNIKAIQEVIAAGMKVVICTGRPLQGSLRFIKKLGFESKDEEYAIFQNGALTYALPNYECIKSYTLNKEAKERAYNFVQRHGLELVAFNTKEMLLVDNPEPSKLVTDDAETLAMELVHINREDFINRGDINKLMLIAAEEVLDRIPQGAIDSLTQAGAPVRSQAWLLELLPKGVNKATALKDLAESLGFTSDEVMAIGDQLNDLEMLTWAKHSVAMAEAVNPVQEVARYHTKSNNQAGVAYALKNFIK